MIVDIPFVCRADVVGKRERRSRKAWITANGSFRIRELDAADAPEVFAFEESGLTVRLVDGALLRPLQGVSDDPTGTVRLRDGIASDVGEFLLEIGLAQDSDADQPGPRIERTVVPDGRIVSSGRDAVAAVIQRWLDANVAVVDGRVHSRWRSRIVSRARIEETLGGAAVRRRLLDLGALSLPPRRRIDRRSRSDRSRPAF